jgi:hypothetical protein
VVEPRTHPIALEALLNEHKEYYMLRSPIYRKAYINGEENLLSSFDNIIWTDRNGAKLRQLCDDCGFG